MDYLLDDRQWFEHSIKFPDVFIRYLQLECFHLALKHFSLHIVIAALRKTFKQYLLRHHRQNHLHSPR